MAKKSMPAKALRLGAAALTVGSMMIAAAPAGAEEWSDTSIGWRYGTQFHEPFNNNNITKNILDLQHAGGYKYGKQFFNVDFLMSNSKDPASGNANAGAQEVYAVYRNTVSMSKITGGTYKLGPIRDIGGTFGFDINTKNDGYGSRKRMEVAGPTLMFDVPGFLDTSILVLNESNAPNGIQGRYTYQTHYMLDVAWGIALGDSPFNFQGYFDYIGAKGLNEFGGATKPEIHTDFAVMMDVGRVMGGPKGTFKVGLEYEYWKNKFGNDASVPGDSGALAKTPMIRAEYHF